MRTAETPYVRGPCRAFQDPAFDRVVVIMGRQMAKTQGIMFNVIGSRLDDDPAPMVYFAPTQEQIDNTIEPKLEAMLEETPSLSKKRGRGHLNKKHLKRVSGVDIRLGWSSSKSQLKADSALYVFVDELDGCEQNIKGGEGSLVDMAEAIISSYPDGKMGLTSTPTEGLLEVENDEQTGLERWARSDSIVSPIWNQWQDGTRYEFAVPCPHCLKYFVPRFRRLSWPEDATPAEARRAAGLLCGHDDCGALIESDYRFWMNDRGVFIAPGQIPEPLAKMPWNDAGEFDFAPPSDDDCARIIDHTRDGAISDVIYGEYVLPADPASSGSFWISGLCTFSAKKSYGWHAAKWLRANASHRPEQIKGYITTECGELYAEEGTAPRWQEVLDCKLDYRLGEIPDEVTMLTAGVDVQIQHIVLIVRGWSNDLSSWLVDRQHFYGDTSTKEPYRQLREYLEREYDGMTISKVLIDSGYRPDHVREFCQANGPTVMGSRGFLQLSDPFRYRPWERKIDGVLHKYGINKVEFDTDYFKSWVHSRIRWPKDEPGAWFVPDDVPEQYCRQVTGERRLTSASGRPVWKDVGRSHDDLDAEALAFVGVHVLGLRVPLRRVRIGDREQKRTRRRPRVGRSNFLRGN